MSPDVHPEVQAAIRYAFSGLKDVNDAIAALAPKVNANSAAVATPSTTGVASGGSSGAGTTLASIGLVNQQSTGNYSPVAADFGALILLTTASSFAISLLDTVNTPFYFAIENQCTGTAVLTPQTPLLINGLTSWTLQPQGSAMVYWDGTNWWIAAIPVIPNFADAETPSGTINGTNVTFTLAHAPNPAKSLQLFNGVIQNPGGNDFTLVGVTITFTLAPAVGATLLAWYRF
jgi:hypothetical protein